MNATRLRWLAVIVPAVLIAVLDLTAEGEWLDVVDEPLRTLGPGVVVIVAALLFARLTFRRIDRLADVVRERNATLERRNASLEALREVSRATTARARIDDIFQAVVEKSRELFDADFAQLTVRRPDGGVPLVASSGTRTEITGPPLTAALRDGETTIGTLVVGRRSGGATYGPDDIELLASLADAAAVAFENERLQRELRELAIKGERERIAREMHDGLAQVLGYVNTKAQAVEELLALSRTEDARRQLAELAGAARSVYVDVREAIVGLTSPVAAERGLVGALEEYAVRFSDASKLATSVEATAPARALRLAPEIQAQVFRIAQEALTNVRKHAVAYRVRLTLDVCDDVLVLSLEDDGVGFDPDARTSTDWPHYGMQAMRDRAASIGAEATWQTIPGAGTVFRLALPIGIFAGAR